MIRLPIRKLFSETVRILRVYNRLRFFRLTRILARIFITYRDRMEIRLDSSNISLRLFGFLQNVHVLHLSGNLQEKKNSPDFLINLYNMVYDVLANGDITYLRIGYSYDRNTELITGIEKNEQE